MEILDPSQACWVICLEEPRPASFIFLQALQVLNTQFGSECFTGFKLLNKAICVLHEAFGFFLH